MMIIEETQIKAKQDVMEFLNKYPDKCYTIKYLMNKLRLDKETLLCALFALIPERKIQTNGYFEPYISLWKD
jgi:hypothetical protein